MIAGEAGREPLEATYIGVYSDDLRTLIARHAVQWDDGRVSVGHPLVEAVKADR